MEQRDRVNSDCAAADEYTSVYFIVQLHAKHIVNSIFIVYSESRITTAYIVDSAVQSIIKSLTE